MRFTHYLSALASVFFFATEVLAHPGHDPQGSPHHNVGFVILSVAILAVVAAFFGAKSLNQFS
ncbi:hypothetical protein SCOR_05075 [Sulfidibacter corallicola]|uniref:Uncharacterized protein n=1 Tax=Sulfidibacter corallicola TaxID=2818388 RepID=A0A8A4TRQ2_SULCO|nr:hypothetical protein [Sulfidibacter corallicola]QTD51854.1 hypothetical protein J3U87_05230 [Sulfidibacter corallicola]